MKKAAAYIRVSTEDQLEYSPESQLQRIQAYADAHQLLLLPEFIFTDEGISGKQIKNRNGFQKMIATAKKIPKPFDVILVWKFSRFARNREDSIVYKSMLRKELEIDVISVSEDIGDEKMSVIFEAMIEAMDEYYSLNLAEEVKRGMFEKATRGEHCSVPPFGYRMENKCLKIIPEEAEIIRYVFSQYAGGVSKLQIAKALNHMGIATHRNKKIENRTIDYWLNNPVYIGKTRWNPSGKTKRNHWNTPDILLNEGIHEPIISEQLWDTVQKRIKIDKALYPHYASLKKTNSHWLTGLLRCGICNSAMVFCNGYYYCSKYKKGICPGNGGLSASFLEQTIVALWDEMQEKSSDIFLLSPKHTDDITDTPLHLQKIKAIKKLDRIQKAFENGIDTIEEYRIKKERILSEIHELKIQIQKTQKKLVIEQKRINFAELISDTKTDSTIKNRLIRFFILKIEKLGKNQIRIVFRI